MFSSIKIQKLATIGLFVLPSVFGQGGTQILQFGSNALPSCAQNCQTLTAAQSGCVPPAAPVTNPGIYKSCFCQSALLATLYSTPNGVCDASCTAASDLALVQSWYKGFCASSALPGDAPATTTTAAGKPAATSNTASTESPSAKKSSGLDSRWKYVIVVVLVILILIVAIIGGISFKRGRRRRAAALRRESQPAGATHMLWGPHQTQNHTGGFGYLEAHEQGGYGEKPKGPRATVQRAPASADSMASQSRWSEGGKKWWKAASG